MGERGDPVLYLTETEVKALLPMERAIEQVYSVFRDAGAGRTQVLPRRRARTEHAQLSILGAAWSRTEGPLLGMKAYSASRHGAHFFVLVWDGETGAPVALLEANHLGQIRTGAASAVATDVLARPDASRLLVIGSGFQALTQVEAVTRVRTFGHVDVYSRSEERRGAFASQIREQYGLDAEAIGPDVLPDRAGLADVIVTVTNAADPVLLGAWVRPGVHVNAAGSNVATHRELDSAAVLKADVVAVDDLEGAQTEAGDLIQAQTDGFLFERAVELGQILSGRASGRGSDRDITLFESQGIATEDLSAAAWVVDEACRRGMGREL